MLDRTPWTWTLASTGGTINGVTAGLRGLTEGGMCLVTVDGRGHFLPDTTPPQMTVKRNSPTPQGGEPLPDDVVGLKQKYVSLSRLKHGLNTNSA